MRLVVDAAGDLIGRVEDGADGPQLEQASQAVIAEWRGLAAETDRSLPKMLGKLTEQLVEQRDAYLRRAARRINADKAAAVEQLQQWAAIIDRAIQLLRDERGRLRAQRRR